MSFKIKQITDPKFPVEYPDGTIVEYDPFAVQESIERYVRQNGSDASISATVYDAIRSAFGRPLSGAVESGEAVYFDGTDSELPGTFTRNQALEIQVELGRFIEELPVSKKASALGRNSSDSSTSHSPSSNR